MTARDRPIEYRRLRAPRQAGAALVDPPLDSAGALLESNRRTLADLSCDIQGRRLADLAADARRDLIDLALRYTRQYADPPTPGVAAPLVVTGHQPLLFHPGVWFKNFALASVAHAHQSTAVNLLIDNDTLRSPTIKVPTGSPLEPRLEVVAMDRHREEVPFEERVILDSQLFGAFGRRVEQLIAPLIAAPLMSQVWPLAVAAAQTNPRLGTCLAQARHQLERSWGLDSLELPLSQLVDTRAFRWLAAHLLAQLPRFRDIYNAALREFRQVNRVRSRTHPVPDLAADGSWIEAPFWIWSTQSPTRRRLFVRHHAAHLELSDREDWQTKLDLSPDADPHTALEQLDEAARQGVKLRPRALITTLFARLVASDLFLHGIGGAKYDQVTDAIIHRFFHVEPPRFLTVTLTAQLPIEHPVVDRATVRHATAWLRELRFHGERFVRGDLAEVPSDSTPRRKPVTSELDQLIAEKRRWLDVEPPRGSGSERHDALTRLNLDIAGQLAERRAELVAYRDQRAVLAARHELLASREFSFCLYPEAHVRSLLESRSGPGTGR